MDGLRPPFRPPCTGCFKTGDCPLTNQAVFEFGECSKDMEHQPPTRVGCVYRFCKRFESNLFFVETMNHFNQIFE